MLRVEGNKIVIEPLRDAIWLSLHSEKVVHITLKELEEESLEQQKKYIEKYKLKVLVDTSFLLPAKDIETTSTVSFMRHYWRYPPQNPCFYRLMAALLFKCLLLLQS